MLDRVLSRGGGWLPLKLAADQLEAAAPRLADLRERAAVAGKQVYVTVYGATQSIEAIEKYGQHGIDRLLFENTDHDGNHYADLLELDRLAKLLPRR